MCIYYYMVHYEFDWQTRQWKTLKSGFAPTGVADADMDDWLRAGFQQVAPPYQCVVTWCYSHETKWQIWSVIRNW
jgi:hypothetical protein